MEIEKRWKWRRDGNGGEMEIEKRWKQRRDGIIIIIKHYISSNKSVSNSRLYQYPSFFCHFYSHLHSPIFFSFLIIHRLVVFISYLSPLPTLLSSSLMLSFLLYIPVSSSIYIYFAQLSFRTYLHFALIFLSLIEISMVLLIIQSYFSSPLNL